MQRTCWVSSSSCFNISVLRSSCTPHSSGLHSTAAGLPHFYKMSHLDKLREMFRCLANKSFVSCSLLDKTHAFQIHFMFNDQKVTLIQPITGEQHVSKVLISRFLSFISKVELSKKSSLHTLLKIAKNYVRSVTGSNLRKIMLLSGKTSISDLRNISVSYHELLNEEAWKVDVIKELISTRHGDLELPGWEKEEIECIMNSLCTQ